MSTNTTEYCGADITYRTSDNGLLPGQLKSKLDNYGLGIPVVIEFKTSPSTSDIEKIVKELRKSGIELYPIVAIEKEEK